AEGRRRHCLRSDSSIERARRRVDYVEWGVRGHPPEIVGRACPHERVKATEHYRLPADRCLRMAAGVLALDSFARGHGGKSGGAGFRHDPQLEHCIPIAAGPTSEVLLEDAARQLRAALSVRKKDVGLLSLRPDSLRT